MKEYEIVKIGILYYTVLKGTMKNINGEYFDNFEECYMYTCNYLRNNGKFILTVPSEVCE